MSNVDKIETVAISKKLFKDLIEDSAFLRCLKANGVDNWDGYEAACNDFEEVEEDDDAEE